MFQSYISKCGSCLEESTVFREGKGFPLIMVVVSILIACSELNVYIFRVTR